MFIYFGADHRGFRLKETLKSFVGDMGYEIADLGAKVLTPDDDYPDYAGAVARKIDLEYETAKGILVCGSGVGMDVAANRFRNVRAALALSNDQVFSARHDDDVNILVLAADFVKEEQAKEIVKMFLVTPFGNDERFVRRLQKITNLP